MGACTFFFLLAPPLLPPLQYILLCLIYNYLDLSHNLREREITIETLRFHVAWI